jgi:hypothetical protein
MATVLTPVAAQASVTPRFDVYSPAGANDEGWAYGSITWSNRTAYIGGWVQPDWVGSSVVVAYFEAFTNDTRVGPTEHRTAEDGYSKNYGFTIGDPDKPGGINNIRITVCNEYPITGQRYCGLRRRFDKP